MSLSSVVVGALAEVLRQDLATASLGHCLRVDDLRADDAHALCEHVREVARSEGASAYVLDGDGDLGIRPERAVELRNRKQGKLCLFVPAGAADTATSSLGNSFAVFDVAAALRRLRGDLLRRLPGEVRAVVQLTLGELRGRSQPSPEQIADYLGAVLAEPTLEVAGAELWRIGLIPDVGGEGLGQRVALNRASAQALIRPARAQASAEERVMALGLRPGAVLNDLLVYLSGKRLREPGSWLPQLANEPYRGRITFERWTFAAAAASDLEAVHVTPLLDRSGAVETWSKLVQPGGPGSQPIAPIGPKKKIGIRWTTVPQKPRNIDRWRIELIPSTEEYGDEPPSAELPSVKVAANRATASLPLDLGLDDDLPVKAVQARVVPLDENGVELRGDDGAPLYGVSGQFWLESVYDSVPELGRQQRETVANLPLGRLRAALEMNAAELDEGSGEWAEGEDLRYFSVPLNRRRTTRVGLSGPLLEVEKRSLREPHTGGAYGLQVRPGERLQADAPTVSREVEALLASDSGAAFLRQRRALFRALEEQGSRGYVAVANWSADLTRRVRQYVGAYQDLIASGEVAALRIDTLQLELQHAHAVETAMVVLPTHPLRLLWYAAYAELLRHWEQQVLAHGKGRERLLDSELVERLTPLNCPAFAVDDRGQPYIFVQNLRFFWGVLLPANVPDPARYVSDVAAVLGFDSDDATTASLSPDRVAAELRAYRAVHPYIDTLRVNVVNPGSGRLIADALRPLNAREPDAGDQQEFEPLRLEILAHTHPPLPTLIPALQALQQELYESQSRGRHHLAPLASVAIRPLESAAYPPGGDVDVAFVLDPLPAKVISAPDEGTQDSCSVYGLLLRFLSDFHGENGRAVWRHRVSLPARAPRERHPAVGPLTNDLVDLHRAYLHAIARALDGNGAGATAAVEASVSPEQRSFLEKIHRGADWVITLDRFFGVEYFDEPSRAAHFSETRKYLLDYTPEFLEGLGHRMLVTTAHREEVEQVLGRAMGELGFGAVEESVGEVLKHLKTISGRLALRVVGDEAHAREVVGLGLVAAHLRGKGELDDSILIPIDTHPELFAPHARRTEDPGTRARCDLLRIRFQRGRMVAAFIEVKARSGGYNEDLRHRMVDQVEATERVFRDLFFRTDPPRLDHVLQRSRLATILRFYLQRAARYGLIHSDDRLRELEDSVGRLESAVADLRVERLGYIVNLLGAPQPSVRLRDTEIHLLTAHDLVGMGMSLHGGSDVASKAELVH